MREFPVNKDDPTYQVIKAVYAETQEEASAILAGTRVYRYKSKAVVKPEPKKLGWIGWLKRLF